MDREIIIVLGKTGQGKSVWTRKFLEHNPRLFMFDPLMDTEVNYISKEGLLDMYDQGLLREGKNFRVGFYNQEDLDLLGSTAFMSKNCFLGIEECAVAFPYGNHITDQWMKECVFLGRHRKISMILTAQRAQSIPIIVRSQATRIISFCQQEGRDMNWLYDYFGSRANEISVLPKLQCLDAVNGEVSRYNISINHKEDLHLSKIPEKVPQNSQEIEEETTGHFDNSD